MELTDGVVTLRTPTADDAEAMAAAVVDSIDHLMPFMAWAHSGYSADDAMQWINNDIDPGSHPFLVTDADARVLGSAGLNRVDRANDKCDLGYWLRPEATGKGYATRCANLLIDYAIEQVGMHRIEIYMSIDNKPSTRVAERTKARYEGIQRGRLKYHGRYHDAHMFAVVADGSISTS